jgi:enediyne biosynthesis protein E4
MMPYHLPSALLLLGNLLAGAFLNCAAQSAAKAANPALSVPQFEDISKQGGLLVSHIATADQRYIVESMSGGVGFIDCDNSGKLSIITANGSTVDRYKKGGDLMITLYRADTQGGDGLKFKDITTQAGLTRKGWGMGVAVADFDNDGWLDIYVTGYGGNVLYRNTGNCKFEDVTEKAGVRAQGFSTGASWGDYDRDGYVDLFVPRYVHVDIDHLPEFGRDKFCRYRGIMVQCGPAGLPGESDLLFHNRGDGTFEEVSKKAGVSDENHYFGMQGLWLDYDNDGWPDLYVTNDSTPSYLYHNKHDGTFEDVSMLSGTALSGDGLEQGSMGVDAADFDHRGLLDLYVTNFTKQPNALYKNLGKDGFSDIIATTHMAGPTYPYVKWGTGFVDFANEGWPDIFVASGHVYPQIEQIEGEAGYREPVQLFHNNRDGSFDDITGLSGLDKLPLQSRRGVAFGDVNNDGKVDILILNVGAPPTLLINRTPGVTHAALFKLIGTKSNRAAIGARITVKAGDLVQLDEIRGGSSYLSQNDLRLHFGLGDHVTMNTVQISWPSGHHDTLSNLPADFIYTIVEGGEILQRTPFAKSAD